MSVDTKTSDLGRSVKKGVAWILTGRSVVFLTSFATTIILARLLEPEDFGVFGIAMILTGFSARFGNIGLGHALIQRKEIRDEHVSSLFVANMIIFPVLAGLLIWLSPRVGSFFETPLAGQVLGVLALVFLIAPFRSVARAILQRKMDFKGPAVANMVDRVVTSFSSIAFALGGYGVWSLVYGYLLGRFSGAILSLIYARWRPRLRYDHAAMKDLFSFGANMFLKNLLRYGSEKVDFFVIGSQLGAAPLGLYEKAFNLMNLTVKELSVRVNPVLFSAFSRIQENRSRLLAAYHKVILTLSLLTFPALSGLYLVAPSFIHVLFGDKWVPSVAPLQIMCLAGLMRVHLQVTSTVINSMGKIALEVWIRALAFLLLAAGCWYGSRWGIVGVAVAVTAVTGALMVMMTFYMKRLMGSTWADFVRPQIPAFLASTFMFGVVFAFQQWTKEAIGIGSVYMLISSTALGVASYAGALWVLRPASVVSLIKELRADVKPAMQRST